MNLYISEVNTLINLLFFFILYIMEDLVTRSKELAEKAKSISDRMNLLDKKVDELLLYILQLEDENKRLKYELSKKEV